MIQLQEQLKQQAQLSAVRWTSPEQMHLTLRFLGHLPDTDLSAVQEALHQATHKNPPLHLAVVGLGCFPSPRRPRVFWAGIDAEGDALFQLQRSVLEHTRSWGKLDDRPFHAHITLARITEIRPPAARRFADLVDKHRQDSAGRWTVQSVELMRSDLSPRGARYHQVRSFPLA